MTRILRPRPHFRRSSVVALLTALALAMVTAPAPAQKKFILQGGTLINGVFERPLKDHLVIVEGGRITGVGKKNRVIIPSDAEVINVSGKYIMPGLVDVHVHEGAPGDWARYLAWGVTSVNCAYASPETALARESWSQTADAPRIFGAALLSAQTPEAARADVRALNAKGIRRIEALDDPGGWAGGRDASGSDPEAMKALLDEARRLRFAVEVDAPAASDAAAALTAGASMLSRGIVDIRVDAPLVESIITNDGFYVPTLTHFQLLAGADTFLSRVLEDPRFRASLPTGEVDSLAGPAFRAAFRAGNDGGERVRPKLGILNDNLQSFLSNYAQVAMGTDAPAIPGIGAHVELELMVKAGMSPIQALTASTFLSAKAIRIFSKTGTIEPGKDADILVLDADPLADIRNTRAISMVVKLGKIYRPAELLGAALPDAPGQK